jgi:PIN domain nuclease of toxin-antitoxin system
LLIAAERLRKKRVMAEFVLDASALLAVIHGEPGAETVMAALEDAIISTVNYAEVISKLVERGATFEDADVAVQKMAIPVAEFDITQARRAGELRVATKSRGLSLADRACLALGEREGAAVLTGDRRWEGAVPDIQVRLFR